MRCFAQSSKSRDGEINATSWVLEAASHQSHRSASQRLASRDMMEMQTLNEEI
eukprot:COSAG01_NODE_47660_length_388_cov_0.878893_2_plen_52_part_01